MDVTKQIITQISDVIAGIDHLYEQWAKQFGFTLLEKQFFHLLSEHENGTLTQKHLCEMMNSSKTTVNTIVKKMVKANYIYLQPNNDSRKEKVIYLTPHGYSIIQAMISPLVSMEIAALSSLDEHEIAAIIHGLSEYKNRLSAHIENGHG